jgi:phosphoserine phosphatase
MNRHLGIDLDHTLIRYDQLLLDCALDAGWYEGPALDKKALKDHLRETLGEDPGERAWQTIQSQAYGPRIQQAELFPGALETLEELRAKGWRISIVSHKSSHSHQHPEIAFHQPALEFLNSTSFLNKLNLSENSVFFTPDRNEKLAKIRELELDFFVDDLTEVLADPAFPARTHALHFGRGDWPFAFPHWQDLRLFFHVLDEYLPMDQLKRWQRMAGTGNARLFQLHLGQRNVVLKASYRDQADPRNRTSAEWDFLVLGKQRAWPTPTPLVRGRDSLLMSYHPASADSVEPRHLLAFLSSLQELEYQPHSAMGPAAGARRTLRDFEKALQQRLDALLPQLEKEKNEQLQELLSRFLGLQKQIRHVFLDSWATRLDDELPAFLLFPSPSDFGPHNALLQKADLSAEGSPDEGSPDEGSPAVGSPAVGSPAVGSPAVGSPAVGSPIFYDFEYAGWDDPAKLMADFHWHLAFDWSLEKRMAVIAPFLQSQGRRDGEIQARYQAVLPLVGLEWVLIALNVFLPSQRVRKSLVDPFTSDQLGTARIGAAKGLLDRLQQAERFVPSEVP